MWFKSEYNVKPNLSIIRNVSKSTGILILNGENDSQTPVQQAFHLFYPSSQRSTGIGPF
jgi:hypothetical protein